MLHTSWLLFCATAFAISFLLTVGFMRPLLKICRRKGLYDLPSERKIHANHIPRLGGVLFIPAMLLGVTCTILLGMANSLSAIPPLGLKGFLIVIGMFLLYIIGLLDDLFGMKASVKFLIQIGVSLFLPFCGLYIHNLYGLFGLFEIPFWAGFPLTVFISLLIVNAINLIDGIDGLAFSLSIVAIVVFGILFFRHELYYYSLYCAALTGTVLGFFLYNMFGNAQHGTKTFMGDTGSLTLGYALTFLAVRYFMTCTATEIHRMHPTALLVPLSLLAVPCFDLVRVSLMRLYHRKPIFGADKSHIHHKCLRAGCTMRQALFLIVALQLVLCVTNGAMVLADWTAPMIIMADILLFVLFNLLLDWRIAHAEAAS